MDSTTSGILTSSKQYGFGTFNVSLNPNILSGIADVFGVNFHDIDTNEGIYIQLRFDGNKFDTNGLGLEISNVTN